MLGHVQRGGTPTAVRPRARHAHSGVTRRRDGRAAALRAHGGAPRRPRSARSRSRAPSRTLKTVDPKGEAGARRAADRRILRRGRRLGRPSRPRARASRRSVTRGPGAHHVRRHAGAHEPDRPPRPHRAQRRHADARRARRGWRATSGLALLAVTDHDTTSALRRGAGRGRRRSASRSLAGCEISTRDPAGQRARPRVRLRPRRRGVPGLPRGRARGARASATTRIFERLAAARRPRHARGGARRTCAGGSSARPHFARALVARGLRARRARRVLASTCATAARRTCRPRRRARRRRPCAPSRRGRRRGRAGAPGADPAPRPRGVRRRSSRRLRVGGPRRHRGAAPEPRHRASARLPRDLAREHGLVASGGSDFHGDEQAPHPARRRATARSRCAYETWEAPAARARAGLVVTAPARLSRVLRALPRRARLAAPRRSSAALRAPAPAPRPVLGCVRARLRRGPRGARPAARRLPAPSSTSSPAASPAGARPLPTDPRGRRLARPTARVVPAGRGRGRDAAPGEGRPVPARRPPRGSGTTRARSRAGPSSTALPRARATTTASTGPGRGRSTPSATSPATSGPSTPAPSPASRASSRGTSGWSCSATTDGGGAFAFVPVGALNVGSIRLTALPRLRTNRSVLGARAYPAQDVRAPRPGPEGSSAGGGARLVRIRLGDRAAARAGRRPVRTARARARPLKVGQPIGVLAE